MNYSIINEETRYEDDDDKRFDRPDYIPIHLVGEIPKDEDWANVTIYLGDILWVEHDLEDFIVNLRNSLPSNIVCVAENYEIYDVVNEAKFDKSLANTIDHKLMSRGYKRIMSLDQTREFLTGLGCEILSEDMDAGKILITFSTGNKD